MNTDRVTIAHPIRRRLWKGVGLILLFIVSVLIANGFLPRERAMTRDMVGHDFLAFYAAGTFARTGQFQNLYDLSAIKAMEAATGKAAGLTVGFGPWWNPPLAAWLFAPFTLVSFNHALLLWEIAGWGMLFVSIALLARMTSGFTDYRTWGLIALLVIASNPVWSVTAHGQNSFLTLLLLTITVALWRSRRAFAAGLVAGLLLYKPQHVAIVSIVLCFSLGWRAAAGLAITTVAMLLATAFTMPGALSDYAHKLPRLLTVMQELSPYSWDRHVTLKAFWRMLLQGNVPGPTRLLTSCLWMLSDLFVVATLLKMALNARRDAEQLDRLIATTILATPLLATFFFDYDLVILAIPAILCAGDAMKKGVDRRLLWTWTIIYLVLNISTPLARITHVVLVTPLLVMLVGMLAMSNQNKAIVITDEAEEIILLKHAA